MNNFIEPKYVTIEDYKTITGYDLALEVNDSDDPVNDGKRRLKEAEEMILDYLYSGAFAFNEEMINEYNLNDFKWCIVKQCEEMIYNPSTTITTKVNGKLHRLGFTNIYRR